MSSTLSFAGKNFKWNNAADAENIVEAINSFKNLQCLVLEANTLGVEAAKAIGDALAKHPEFERAHWKDLFTGRLKNEIPQSLKHLFSGLMRAKAKLKELDLSDNALGPVGVEGMIEFMKSPVCYSLQVLRLNNNGLGIKGGTMLAESLKELVRNAKAAGTPLSLKVFIAGRNRLEKEGARVFSELFSSIQTLEEIAMPQNGIFHEGIGSLAKALKDNPNIRIINLNDNTFTPKGARAMAQYLPTISKLEVINFGDCLIKTAGAIALADALKNSHPNLKSLQLDSNEIGAEGGIAIVDAIANKQKLKSLMLDCNQFGEDGCNRIRTKMDDMQKLEFLESLEEDEGADGEEEEDGEDEESGSSTSESCDSDQEVIEVLPQKQSGVSPLKRESSVEATKCTSSEFALNPTASRLLGLGNNAPTLLVEEARSSSSSSLINADVIDPDAGFIQECITLFMKSASLSSASDQKVKDAVHSCCNELIRSAFEFAKEKDIVSIANNTLLVHFGFLKSENKSFKLEWDLRNCLSTLTNHAGVLPPDTKKTLQFFFARPCDKLDEFSAEKHKLMMALFKL